jgi:hypothetical protein
VPTEGKTDALDPEVRKKLEELSSGKVANPPEPWEEFEVHVSGQTVTGPYVPEPWGKK